MLSYNRFIGQVRRHLGRGIWWFDIADHGGMRGEVGSLIVDGGMISTIMRGDFDV